jgi:hypothetical protein
MRMSSGIRFSRGSPEDTRPLQFEPNTFGRYRDSGPLALGLIFRDAVQSAVRSTTLPSSLAPNDEPCHTLSRTASIRIPSTK